MKTPITVALLALASLCAQATTAWDEAVHGDLSDNGLDNTPVAFALGHNTVLGSTGNAGSGVDRDYFRFTIPDGAVLSELVLLPVSFVSGSYAFVGIQAGPQLTVTPSGGGIEAFYGFGHYENSDIGTNVLPRLVGAARSPIPAGTYSVWIQETGGQVPYGLDFVITSAVPEPATAFSLGLGLLGLACRRFVLQRR